MLESRNFTDYDVSLKHLYEPSNSFSQNTSQSERALACSYVITKYGRWQSAGNCHLFPPLLLRPQLLKVDKYKQNKPRYYTDSDVFGIALSTFQTTQASGIIFETANGQRIQIEFS